VLHFPQNIGEISVFNKSLDAPIVVSNHQFVVLGS
jgi:hypothetical protein